MIRTTSLSRIILVLLFLSPVVSARADNSAVQTTLYFGLAIAGGKHVSEKQWQAFLADTVTPRFPDGLTVLAATGQWRDPKDKSGRVNSEATKVVIIVHADTPASTKAVAEVKAAYIKRFHQKSVFETDLPVRVVE